jgi:hypothetical protein
LHWQQQQAQRDELQQQQQAQRDELQQQQQAQWAELRRQQQAQWAELRRQQQARVEELPRAINSELKPVRDFIEPDEIPPEGVGAYGMVAFSHKPTSTTRERFTFVCEAFLSTLPQRQSLPTSVPISQQMITYWPIEERKPERIAAGDCDYMIDKYHLFSGLESIQDVGRQGRRLAERRGPFLIGWSPAESRYEKDKVVLIMDLSNFESATSFREAFQSWRTKITENPSLWHNGFSIERIRIAMRDFLDRYGDAILKAMKD